VELRGNDNLHRYSPFVAGLPRRGVSSPYRLIERVRRMFSRSEMRALRQATTLLR
jgi:hypothetical protein